VLGGEARRMQMTACERFFAACRLRNLDDVHHHQHAIDVLLDGKVRLFVPLLLAAQ
jgi:hypothetical protein